MKNIMNIGNKGIQFVQRIDNKLNKNIMGSRMKYQSFDFVKFLFWIGME